MPTVNTQITFIMQQLKLNLGIPDEMDDQRSLPTQSGYTDWQLEQDNKPFKGDRIIWDGVGATVKKVYPEKVMIVTDNYAMLTVPIAEITIVAPTVTKTEASAAIMPLCREKTTEAVGDGQRISEVESRINTLNNRLTNYRKQLKEAKTQKAKTKIQRNIDDCYEQLDYVGRRSCLPTFSVGRQDLLPTEFKESLEGMGLDALYRLKALIEWEISKRSENLCRETEGYDRSLPTKKVVGRKNDEEFLPTTINDWPHPYIEFKKLPYQTKTKGVRYRKAYYLRDHHNKGKSKYLCSKRENIPEHLRELTIYGEDEIPF